MTLHASPEHQQRFSPLTVACLKKSVLVLGVLVTALGSTACSPPIGVTKVSPDKAYAIATHSPLS
ncbi:MAG: hypothetical protein EBY15_06190, partial [Gammaproteobacteria bacterium]|nr:hypothetical protein [Gammaproteobacteria bacterium]